MREQEQVGTGLSDEAIQWLIALDCGSADTEAFEAWRSADPRHAAAFAQVAATWRRTTDPRLPAMLDPISLEETEAEEEIVPAPPAMLDRKSVV